MKGFPEGVTRVRFGMEEGFREKGSEFSRVLGLGGAFIRRLGLMRKLCLSPLDVKRMPSTEAH